MNKSVLIDVSESLVNVKLTAASEGCFGVTDGTTASNDYSNIMLDAIINQADKSKTNKGKIEVVIDKRDASEKTNEKTENQR